MQPLDNRQKKLFRSYIKELQITEDSTSIELKKIRLLIKAYESIVEADVTFKSNVE